MLSIFLVMGYKHSDTWALMVNLVAISQVCVLFPTWTLVSSLTEWIISLPLWISSKGATSGDYRPLIACTEHLTRSRYPSREGWGTVMGTFECGKMSLEWVMRNAVVLLYTMCCIWQEFRLALGTWFQYWLQYLEPGLIIRIICNQWNLT